MVTYSLAWILLSALLGYVTGRNGVKPLYFAIATILLNVALFFGWLAIGAG